MNPLKKLFGRFSQKGLSFSQVFGVPGLRADEKWGKLEQMMAYSTSSYVYTCVRIRAEKVGMVKFQLKRKGNKKNEMTEVTNHWVLDLLAKPNQFQNGSEFIEYYQMLKDLTGSVFVYMMPGDNGQIAELHCLRPDLMKIKMGPGDEIVAFEYNLPGKGNTRLFKPEEILFSISASPLSPLIGQSPLEPGQMAVDTEIQLTKYQNKVLKNGGKVEGIINYKVDHLTQDQVDNIKKQFAAHYSGSDNSGKPLVLFGDSEYKNLGLTPTEMSYLDSKKATRDDILLLYRVPKILVAQTDDVNYASAKEAKAIFISDIIKPLINGLTTKLNEFLVPAEFELGFDDPTPADVELNLKRNETGIKNYYLTINEARRRDGLEDIPEGDKILVPFSLVPLDERPEEATQTQEKGSYDAFMKAKVKELIKSGIKPLKASRLADEAWEKRLQKYVHPLKDDTKRKQYAERWIKISDRREDEFMKEIKRYWRNQLKRMTDSLDSVPKRRRKGILDEIWNLEMEVKLAQEMVLPLIRKYLLESGEDTMELFGVGGEFSLTSTLQTSLDQKAAIFARSINETTFATLKEQFRISIEQQENRRELIKRIQETYGNITKSRAATIARTEVTSASQMGIQAGYEQSGVQTKIWVSTPDDRTRDTHLAIDGEEQPINKRFSNGLLFPGDPAGPTEEVINCRCSI